MQTLPSWLARGCLPLPGSCPPRAPEGCSRVVTAVFRACLAPAVASASEYAHRGLDKLEENLPILQQHTEKVTGARRREPPRGRGPGWLSSLASTWTRADKRGGLPSDTPVL